MTINYTGGGAYVGGIAGYINNTTSALTLNKLENKANITGASYVGGIAGNINASGWVDNYTGTITECKNEGSITGSGDYVGGIAGCAKYDDTASGSYYYTLNVTDTENVGNIAGKTYVGGLFGYASSDSKNSIVAFSSSIGQVTGTSNTGDIAGELVNITVR